jgi:hypothetical protein
VLLWREEWRAMAPRRTLSPTLRRTRRLQRAGDARAKRRRRQRRRQGMKSLRR